MIKTVKIFFKKEDESKKSKDRGKSICLNNKKIKLLKRDREFFLLAELDNHNFHVIFFLILGESPRVAVHNKKDSYI